VSITFESRFYPFTGSEEKDLLEKLFTFDLEDFHFVDMVDFSSNHFLQATKPVSSSIRGLFQCLIGKSKTAEVYFGK
jgi:hypothetical protein